MPKLLCKCNEVLRFSDIPCAIEWHVLADTALEELGDDARLEDISRSSKVMLRCPRCGRLWLFWDDVPTEYVPITADSPS